MKKAIAAACVAALAAGAVVAVGQSPKQDETSRCVVSGARTVVANEDVRVYSREKASRDDSQATGLYACRYSTGRRVALGTAYVPFSDEPDDSAPVRYIRDISLSDEAGGTTPRVAFVDTNCVNRDPCSVEVVVKSLGNGKTERRFKAGGPFDMLDLSVPTDQDGIAIAWLETSPNGSCESGCRVHLVKESGDKVLDEGTDIDSDLFGSVANDRPGVIPASGTNEFVWRRGATVKVASFND
ncbi:MAG: hypothetical protein M3340_12010 [Actinomycetota bacterium]|nr:hypothetical protein [Actinomycetota bacterium]